MKQSGYRNPFEGRRRREPARSKEEVLRRIMNHRQARHGTSSMTKQFNCPACEELYTQLGLAMVAVAPTRDLLYEQAVNNALARSRQCPFCNRLFVDDGTGYTNHVQNCTAPK